MPFYEYQCAACGRHHEELQKVTDPALRQCPHCGRPALERLVSAPVFRLKGGGWYETDFKKDQEAKRNLAGDKEPPAEKPADAKAEAKPADSAQPEPAKPATAADGAKPAPVKPPAPRAKRPALRRRKPRP